MKEGIHPDYHPVVFIDVSTGDEIQTRSTVTSEKTREIDGVSHFVINCDITSFTHPFYTGKQKLLDAEGRIDRFRKKYAHLSTSAPSAPIEEPATEETVSADAAAEEAPVEEPAAEEAPIEEPAAEETVSADAAAEEAPVEEPATEEAPIEEPVAEETVSADAAAEEAPVEEPATEEDAGEKATAEKAGE